MGSPLEGWALVFGLHMREQKHKVLTVQTFNNFHKYCPKIRKQTKAHAVGPAWFDFIKRKTEEIEVHANRSKMKCSKSMTSIYGKEFRFRYILKTTIFLHFSSFLGSFSWELFFEKRCLDLTTFPFKRKPASLNQYDKAPPFQCYKGCLYLPMYQYVFLFHSLVTDLWCSLSADESLMAFMEQSFTASFLQGLLYHGEQRAKVYLTLLWGEHLRIL